MSPTPDAPAILMDKVAENGNHRILMMRKYRISVTNTVEGEKVVATKLFYCGFGHLGVNNVNQEATNSQSAGGKTMGQNFGVGLSNSKATSYDPV